VSRRTGVFGLGVLTILLVSPAAAAPVEAPGDIFVVDFTLTRNNTVNMSQVAMTDGESTDFGSHDAQEPNYRLTVAAANGSVLFAQGLKIDFTVYPYPQEPRTVDDRDFYWRLPYMADAHHIELRDVETAETVFRINLTDRFCGFDQACSGFCDGKEVDVDCTCGDGVCQDIENTEPCGDDCGDQSSGTSGGSGGIGGGDGQGEIDIVVMGMVVLIAMVIGTAVVYLWREVAIE